MALILLFHDPWESALFYLNVLNCLIFVRGVLTQSVDKTIDELFKESRTKFESCVKVYMV